MKNKIAFLMVGVSGSGKSTAQKAISDLLKDCTQAVFSLDDCRFSFMNHSHAGQGWSDNDSMKAQYAMVFAYATEHEKEFKEFTTQEWNKCLAYDVLFIDNTNLSKKSRARWTTEARAKGFKVCAVQMQTPLQVVIDRQKTRTDKSVPESVVRDMYMRQTEVLLGEEVDFLIIVDGTKQPSFNLDFIE